MRRRKAATLSSILIFVLLSSFDVREGFELNLNLLFFRVKTTFYERLKILLSFTVQKKLLELTRKIKIKGNDDDGLKKRTK